MTQSEIVKVNCMAISVAVTALRKRKRVIDFETINNTCWRVFEATTSILITCLLQILHRGYKTSIGSFARAECATSYKDVGIRVIKWLCNRELQQHGLIAALQTVHSQMWYSGVCTCKVNTLERRVILIGVYVLVSLVGGGLSSVTNFTA